MAHTSRGWMLGATLGVALLVAGLLGTPTPSAAFTYSESVSGDLGTFLGGPVFAFDAGVNTVSGTFNNNGPAGTQDNDSFAFSVPAALQLQSVYFAFVIHGDATNGHTDFELCPSNAFCNIFNELSSRFVFFDPAEISPISVFDNGLPLGPGTYGLQQPGVGGNIFKSYSVDYTWTFNVGSPSVPSVPEPASITLIGLGLMTLAAVGRWKKRSHGQVRV
jgi:hypothetical protein